jgi:hypothetical protein
MNCEVCGHKKTLEEHDEEIMDAPWEDYFAIFPITIEGEKHYFKTLQRQPHHEYWSAEFGFYYVYNYQLKANN